MSVLGEKKGTIHWLRKNTQVPFGIAYAKTISPMKLKIPASSAF